MAACALIRYRKCIITGLLILCTLAAMTGIWFYVDIMIEELPEKLAREAAAETEAAEAAAREAAIAARPTGGIHDVGNFFSDAGTAVAGAATDAVEVVGDVGEGVVNTVSDPMSLLDGPWKLATQGMAYGGSIGAGVAGLGAAISGNEYETSSGWNTWVVRGVALLTILLMISAMACAWYNPTSLDGWSTKGLGIAGAISAAATVFLLWKPIGREVENGEALSLADPSASYPDLPITPTGAIGALAGDATAAAVDLSPGPIIHRRNPVQPGPVRSRTPFRLGPVHPTRRLIEQKFQFSDHSMLLYLSLIMVCLAVYCFMHQSASTEIKTSSACIAKKHPVIIHVSKY